MHAPFPALKSLDDKGHVIYVGSLSKSLFPGLRLGFMVGPKKLIEEARALRRLMVRHAPKNTKRPAALFLSPANHARRFRRLHRPTPPRGEPRADPLSHYFPPSAGLPVLVGPRFWVKVPAGPAGRDRARAGGATGILIEPGRINFGGKNPPRNYFRLAFSSIDEKKIAAGVKLLAETIKATE